MIIPFKREIKTFVRRQRHLTTHQEKAMTEAWPQWGVGNPEALLSFEKLFSRSVPVIVEIGFGSGDTLIPMAKANPDKNYLGIEVHEPGIAAVMMQLLEQSITNVRVIRQDAVMIFEKYIPDNSLSRIHIYFPDPWPKKKHHKRRLLNPDFVKVLTNKLHRDGAIHCATDWEHYAMQMMRVFSAETRLKNRMGESQFADNSRLLLR